jgi:hypothetical protein
MATLITVQQANAHLRLDIEGLDDSPISSTDDRLPDLELKMEQAEGIVINYLKLDDDALDIAINGDSDASPEVPATWSTRDRYNVQAAVLLVLSALFDDEMNRTLGDYMKPDGVIPLLLMRLRDPAYA